MPVDTPTLLNVLAHEIRGPVSALQGFLRLLEQQSGTPVPAQLPDAMRRSLSRLASLGAEASDLSSWLRRPQNAEPSVVTLAALLERVRQGSPHAQPAEHIPDAVAETPLELLDVAFITRAITVLAASVARDFDRRPVVLTPSLDDSRVNIHVHAGGQTADEPSPPPGAAAASASVPFDRGGMGLELVLAEHVLATHGATVSPTTDGLVIHLRQRLRP